MSKGLAISLILLSVAQLNLPSPKLKGDTLTFDLPDLDGNLVRASDLRFKDKIVLVDLWGTWCPPCRQAIPFLVELQRRYDKDGLVVVGIAFERGDSAESRRAQIREFEKKFKINYLLLDAGGEPDVVLKEALPDIHATSAFPTMFIIGPKGKVVFSKSGFQPDDKEVIETELKKIIAGKIGA